MERNGQPGVRFNNIILISEEFSRLPNIPKGSSLKLDIVQNVKTEGKNGFSEIKVSMHMEGVNGTVHPLVLNCVFRGFFSLDEKNRDGGRLDLDSYLKDNSGVLMFPYIREHISSVTRKAGAPVDLPLVNIRALMKKKTEGKKEAAVLSGLFKNEYLN